MTTDIDDTLDTAIKAIRIMPGGTPNKYRDSYLAGLLLEVVVHLAIKDQADPERISALSAAFRENCSAGEGDTP